MSSGMSVSSRIYPEAENATRVTHLTYNLLHGVKGDKRYIVHVGEKFNRRESLASGTMKISQTTQNMRGERGWPSFTPAASGRSARGPQA